MLPKRTDEERRKTPCTEKSTFSASLSLINALSFLHILSPISSLVLKYLIGFVSALR